MHGKSHKPFFSNAARNTQPQGPAVYTTRGNVSRQSGARKVTFWGGGVGWEEEVHVILAQEPLSYILPGMA